MILLFDCGPIVVVVAVSMSPTTIKVGIFVWLAKPVGLFAETFSGSRMSLLISLINIMVSKIVKLFLLILFAGVIVGQIFSRALCSTPQVV